MPVSLHIQGQEGEQVGFYNRYHPLDTSGAHENGSGAHTMALAYATMIYLSALLTSHTSASLWMCG
jgi:hypothetical protein